MRKINPDHISALLAMINNGPFYQLLSMRVIEIGEGHSRLEAELQQKHQNPFGITHGGVYASILDTAAYWSAYCDVEEGAGLTTIDISSNNLAMSSGGKVLVEGRLIKAGRSICLVEADARDESGKLLAHATSKLMVLEGRQSISQAVAAMGHEPLPPKYLDQE